MRAAALVLVAAAAPTAAHADRREASLHAQLVGGVLSTGDVDATGSARAALGGLAVRASYANRDSFQYDLALSLFGHGEAAFAARTFMPEGRPPVTGPYRVGGQLTRLDGGVTLRLGVRWIPTVRVGLGVQLRRLGGAMVTAGPVTAEARPDHLQLDLVGTTALGLDHRINRRLIVGASAGGSLAAPLGGARGATAEVTVHAAYYWYPRW